MKIPRLPSVALAGLMLSLGLSACVVPSEAASDPAAEPTTATVSSGMPALPEGGEGEHGYSAAAESECLTKGGTYARRGMMGLYSCALPYADAGKVCRKASDCEGQCRIEDMDPDTKVGKCQATNDPFGCYSYLEENGQVVGICVD